MCAVRWRACGRVEDRGTSPLGPVSWRAGAGWSGRFIAKNVCDGVAGHAAEACALLEGGVREWEEAAGLRSDAVRGASRRAEQLFEALPAEERARVRPCCVELSSRSGRSAVAGCSKQRQHAQAVTTCAVAKRSAFAALQARTGFCMST